MTKLVPFDIARQFVFPAPVKSVEVYGGGIINDTYLVNFSSRVTSPNARTGQRAILQRINSAVFPHPELIMHNLQRVLTHAVAKVTGDDSSYAFILPPIYPTRDGAAFYRDQNSNCWRAMGFIEGTRSYDKVKNRQQAHQTGVALARFHLLVEDIPVQQLQDTLPGFHVTPKYLQHFDEVWTENRKPKAKTSSEAGMLNDCVRIINEHRSLASVLEDAKPPLPLRIIHGDPKLNNFLFDEQSDTVVSLIDLDTVKPGLLHYDLGDCIRSSCNPSGEFPDNIDSVNFDLDICQAILQGYLQTAVTHVSAQDLDLVYDCIRLLPFELGLRFLTDHLQGDVYFKVKSQGDNLYRAKVQFQLMQRIEQQAFEIQKVVEQLCQ